MRPRGTVSGACACACAAPGWVLPGLLGLGLMVCANMAAARECETHDVLWQFHRTDLESKPKLYGRTLALQLDDLRIRECDKIRFTWDEAQVHDVQYTSSEEAFEACDQVDATRVGTASPTPRGNFEFTPGLGVSYFFDSMGDNCAKGMLKIKVFVFTEADYTEQAPTPPNTVTAASALSGQGNIHVTWGTQMQPTPIEITQDDALAFEWSGGQDGLSLSLVQVTADAYASCKVDGGVIKTWSERARGVKVVVPHLPVGSNYFVSSGPGHCSPDMDAVRLEVIVTPPAQRLWATVWSVGGAGTEAPVYLSLSGTRYDDPEHKPWTSREMQLNQRATDADLSKHQTVDIRGDRDLLELYTMDVGSIAAVRLRRSPGSSWAAQAVRIQKKDQQVESQTFACAAHLVDFDGAESDVQYCVLSNGSSTGSAASSTVAAGSPAAESCTCFRDFTVAGGRVLACTSDGCYSTSAEGNNGWSDMTGVRRLSGQGTDQLMYGTDHMDRAVVSSDYGLNWAAAHHKDVAIVTPARNFQFDVSKLTTKPLDKDVIPGPVEWGLTSQGVHFNRAGEWVLHALWACECDGACGLKCNQPNPNLIAP